MSVGKFMVGFVVAFSCAAIPLLLIPIGLLGILLLVTRRRR